MNTGINNPVQVPNVAQPSQATGALENGAQTKLTGMWQAVTQRFSEALEDFRFEYARRRALKVTTEGQVALRTDRVAAFLISENSSEVVCVAEGSNFFSFSDGAILRSKRPENPYERADLSLSVLGDRLLQEDKEGPAHKHLTNDRAVIGNRTYVVKVIPEEYRREIVLEGGRHV